MFIVGRKRILVSLMIVSLVGIMLLTQPRGVTRTNYTSAWYYSMGLSGLIGMVVITRQVILGIRPLSAGWVKDFFRVNGLHKRLGIGTIMAILFHPIAAVIAYSTSWLYAITLDFSSSFEGWVSIGKIGFDLILIVLASSVISRKLLAFRTRYWIHLLSYPAFVAIWLHAWNTGTMIDTNMGVRVYWIVLGVILAGAILVRIAYQFGWLKHTTAVIAHNRIANDIYEITVNVKNAITYTPGQFVYVQYPRGGESHPFTVLAYDKHTKQMKIAYKTFGKWTQNLAKRLDQPNQSIYIDGPYGNFTSEISDLECPIICIAAGIGITPFYQLIHDYAPTKQMTLLYLNSTRSDIAYESELEAMLGDACVHVLSRESHAMHTNELVGSRISVQMLRSQLQGVMDIAQFYVCGGGPVIKTILSMLDTLGVHRSRISYEPFDM